MLLNEFYTYEQLEGDSIDLLKFRIKILADNDIFMGHFPGNPIMPGVCQMEIVKEVLGDYLGKEIFYSFVSDIKFINMWAPDDSEVIYLEICANEIENGCAIKASIYACDKVYFKLKGLVNDSL
jgi:3-hydroxyacyl-[acyl-carrier-protein] dehydratase